MSKRIKISVPDSFLGSLNELVSRVKKEDEEAREESVARKRLEREREEKIKEERIKKGLKHAEHIVAWLGAFRESETGQALIQIGHSYVDGVFIFDGHVFQKPWRGIGVGEQGVWWIKSGCGSRQQYVKTALELAEAIDPEILETAHAWIKQDKVWECIQARIEGCMVRKKETQEIVARLARSRGTTKEMTSSFGGGIY